MKMNTVLEFKHIYKDFFGVSALEDISFSLKKGQILSLIGENGAGKSTMMNILGGILQASSGEMVLHGQTFKPLSASDATEAKIAFIHQELNLFGNLSIIENMCIPNYPTSSFGVKIINYSKIIKEVEKSLKQFNLAVSPYTKIDNLSPGNRQLVEIMRAIRTNADIYIFDEPTTSLTLKEKEVLFENIRLLKQKGKSIIYISHILDDLLLLTDDIIVLKDGAISSKGEVTSYTKERMIEDMVGRELQNIYPIQEDKELGNEVLRLKDFGDEAIQNISFSINEKEIFGLFGLMGSGRTELARMVFGLDKSTTGEVYLSGTKISALSPQNAVKNKVAFITEDRRGEGLFMDMTVIFNSIIVILKNFVQKLTRKIDYKSASLQVKDITTKLNLKSANLATQKVKSLSGGNQQKVVLAKWLLANPKLIILDEPTRGVDVGAKHEIYTLLNQIANKGAALWVISSELEELMGICDRIAVMSEGSILKIFSKEEFDDKKIINIAFNKDFHAKNI